MRLKDLFEADTTDVPNEPTNTARETKVSASKMNVEITRARAGSNVKAGIANSTVSNSELEKVLNRYTTDASLELAVAHFLAKHNLKVIAGNFKGEYEGPLQ